MACPPHWPNWVWPSLSEPWKLKLAEYPVKKLEGGGRPVGNCVEIYEIRKVVKYWTSCKMTVNSKGRGSLRHLQRCGNWFEVRWASWGFPQALWVPGMLEVFWRWIYVKALEKAPVSHRFNLKSIKTCDFGSFTLFSGSFRPEGQSEIT